MHLPRQRTTASGTTSHVVVVHGGRLATSSAVDALGDGDWSVGSATEIGPDAWRVVLLPRD